MTTLRLHHFLMCAILILTLFTALESKAKSFSNAYVSFDLPDKWACVLEQTEWVCKPNAPEEAPLAIIILTAKEVGPSDSLEEYERHLKTPRQIPSRTGAVMNSQVVEVKQVKINDHMWVDGMHESSEVPNYYTRYLATKEDKIAVLVTFSAHKLHYTKFSQDFIRSIQSLRVIASKSLMASMNHPSDESASKFGPNSGDPNMVDPEVPAEPDQGSGGDVKKNKVVIGASLLILVVAAYLLIKRGAGKKKKRP
jgi:hypothetical protein